jgi:hypothetical protein
VWEEEKEEEEEMNKKKKGRREGGVRSKIKKQKGKQLKKGNQNLIFLKWSLYFFFFQFTFFFFEKLRLGLETPKSTLKETGTGGRGLAG